MPRYVVADGQVVKVSDEIPSLAKPVYFNKGGVKQFDPSARETFHSKQEKRQWLKANGMAEGGLLRKQDEDRIVSRCGVRQDNYSRGMRPTREVQSRHV